MAKKKKYYYYVLVFTDDGPVYVTSLGEHHWCHWNATEKPYELGKYFAEEVAMGLGLNGTNAVEVVMPFEMEHQPYRYEDGSFEWKWNKEEVSK